MSTKKTVSKLAKDKKSALNDSESKDLQQKARSMAAGTNNPRLSQRVTSGKS